MLVRICENIDVGPLTPTLKRRKDEAVRTRFRVKGRTQRVLSAQSPR